MNLNWLRQGPPGPRGPRGPKGIDGRCECQAQIDALTKTLKGFGETIALLQMVRYVPYVEPQQHEDETCQEDNPPK